MKISQTPSEIMGRFWQDVPERIWARIKTWGKYERKRLHRSYTKKELFRKRVPSAGLQGFEP